jgi:hypothetical protein
VKYRKKPVVIEAMLWDGNNDQDLLDWAEANGVWGDDFKIDTDKKQVIILTLGGYITASKGDYVIKGVKGEFYPCKPDIFLETYECVSDLQPSGSEKKAKAPRMRKI